MGSHSLGTPSSSPFPPERTLTCHKRRPCPLLGGQARQLVRVSIAVSEPVLGVLTTRVVERVVDRRGDLRARWSCLTAHHPEVLVANANARLTPAGRLICASTSPLAAQPPMSPPRWASPAPPPTAGGARYRAHGRAGLADRPSTAHTHPHRVPTGCPRRWRPRSCGCAARTSSARRGSRCGWPAGLHRAPRAGPPPAAAAGLDGPAHRPADPPLRAHQTRRAGPPGRQEARPHPRRRRPPRSRPPRHHPQGPGNRLRLRPRGGRRPLPAGLRRGPGRRAHLDLHWVLAPRPSVLHRPRHPGAAGADRQRPRLQQRPVRRRRGRRRRHPRAHPPYRPQTNGKVERFNRTLLAEWAYVQAYTSNQQRTAALDAWLHLYNHHRARTALGGRPPISRVNNGPGSYT
jgi:Integrase core domain